MAQPSRSELYAGGHSTDLAFAGVLSHKLAMKQAQDTLAGTDAALAKLQSQMASHQKDKQSKQYVYSEPIAAPPASLAHAYPSGSLEFTSFGTARTYRLRFSRSKRQPSRTRFR